MRVLAVVTPIGPGHGELSKEAYNSVVVAQRYGTGPFSTVKWIEVDDREGRLRRSKARNQGVHEACDRYHADWIFFLDADDYLDPLIFDVINSDHLELYDGIWGSIYYDKGELATQEYPRNYDELIQCFPPLALQIGHLIRSSVALSEPFNEKLDIGEDYEYYLRVWRNYKCVKLGEPLFIYRPGCNSLKMSGKKPVVWNVVAEKMRQSLLLNQ